MTPPQFRPVDVPCTSQSQRLVRTCSFLHRMTPGFPQCTRKIHLTACKIQHFAKTFLYVGDFSQNPVAALGKKKYHCNRHVQRAPGWELMLRVLQPGCPICKDLQGHRGSVTETSDCPRGHTLKPSPRGETGPWLGSRQLPVRAGPARPHSRRGDGHPADCLQFGSVPMEAEVC